MPSQTERIVRMFRTMCIIREFEEQAGAEKGRGNVPGHVHQSTGQEAIPVGVCANLAAADYLFSNHRGHGHAIAKGADPLAMMREIFGKAGGTCKGKGGSMHIADFSVGMLGANGILADGATMTVGAAQAIRLRGENRIACCFIGDGTTNRGPFFEALNWAKVFDLPALFVCEDNQYASTTRTDEVIAGPGVAARAAVFGIETLSVDGNDLVAVDTAAAALIGAIRSEGGPRFLHARTYRVRGHLSMDKLTYRRAGETEAHFALEPLARCEAWLIGQGVARERCLAVRAEARALIERAISEAQTAPFPDRREAWTDVQDAGAPQWHA